MFPKFRYVLVDPRAGFVPNPFRLYADDTVGLMVLPINDDPIEDEIDTWLPVNWLPLWLNPKYESAEAGITTAVRTIAATRAPNNFTESMYITTWYYPQLLT